MKGGGKFLHTGVDLREKKGPSVRGDPSGGGVGRGTHWGGSGKELLKRNGFEGWFLEGGKITSTAVSSKGCLGADSPWESFKRKKKHLSLIGGVGKGKTAVNKGVKV